MRHSVTWVQTPRAVLLLTLFCVWTANAQAELAATRKILLFGKTTQPALVKKQESLLLDQTQQIQERDLEIIIVDSSDATYHKYKIDEDSFTLILVGKDGGIKLRSNKIVAPAKIFKIIDRMPMRRSEIKAMN